MNFNNKESSENQNYSDKTKANGIEMSVAWDDEFGDYTIYFPQIRLNNEATSKGIYDQIIRVSENPDSAKKVFNFAIMQAFQGKPLNDLYKAVLNYSRSLPAESHELISGSEITAITQKTQNEAVEAIDNPFSEN